MDRWGDRGVKRKLHKAYGQFQAFSHLPCCVVLATNDPLVELADPDIMLGAMYRRVAVEVRCDPLSGEVVSTEGVFDRGGRMLDTTTGSKRNTAISALITLQRFRPGAMRFRKLVRLYKDNPNETPGPDFDVDEYVLGVTVWENVYARIPLPSDIFHEDYDQRYGLIEDDRIDRIYAGRGVLQYEIDDSGSES